MSNSVIEAAIPHRGPMLLVDEVVEQSDHQIVCHKTFRPEEYFFQGHYPDYPLVPGVILCEATMQAGAIMLSRFVTDGEGVPVATRLSDVKFKKMVRPGDKIVMEVKLNERLADAFFMSGKVTVAGKVAVRFDFACTVAKTEA